MPVVALVGVFVVLPVPEGVVVVDFLFHQWLLGLVVVALDGVVVCEALDCVLIGTVVLVLGVVAFFGVLHIQVGDAVLSLHIWWPVDALQEATPP